MTRAVSKLFLSTLGLASFAFFSVASAADKPAWTILVYANGDHNLSPSLVEDILEMQKCGSSKDFNIVVQTDFQAHDEETYKAGLPERYGKRTTRWLVTQSNAKVVESEVVARFDEVNSDIKKKLTDFVQWGIEEYPADRYGLILWDHGGAWMGFGGDSHNGRLKKVSPMKLNEIQAAIEAGIEDRIEEV